MHSSIAIIGHGSTDTVVIYVINYLAYARFTNE